MTSRVVIADSGRSFLNEAQEIASLFVQLSEDDSFVTSEIKRSPAPGRRVECDTAQGGPPMPSTAAFTIAQRLKEIGDKIDEKVKIELQQVLSEELKPSNIFQVKAEEFSGVCREVLSRCSGRLRNGWEQVAVVYIGVRDVIRELRAQGESQGSARETMVNGFAGEVLEELRLEPWIRSQGGLSQIGQPVQGTACVPIEGTEV